MTEFLAAAAAKVAAMLVEALVGRLVYEVYRSLLLPRFRGAMAA